MLITPEVCEPYSANDAAQNRTNGIPGGGGRTRVNGGNAERAYGIIVCVRVADYLLIIRRFHSWPFRKLRRGYVSGKVRAAWWLGSGW